jgi:hypothetical protein
MTIKKSQDRIIQRAGIYTEEPISSHRQRQFALEGSRNINNKKILKQTNKQTKNKQTNKQTTI